MRTFIRYTLIIFAALFILAGAIAMFSPTGAKPTDVTLSKLVQQINAGEVKTITVQGDIVEIVLRANDAKENTKREPGATLV